MLALPGGWIADRLIGQRRAVLVGGVIIAAGHYTLAVPALSTFYLGLILVVLGTGLLKPNVSAIVADLYPEGGARRDAGFSIFYMGINIGALFGTTVCPFLGEKISWHLGFSAAGIGMTLGLIQYVWGGRHLGTAGGLKGDAQIGAVRSQAWRTFFFGVATVAAIAVALVGLSSGGIIPFTLLGFVDATGYLTVSLATAYFTYVILFGGLSTMEKKRVGVIAILFVGAAMFWAGFEQAGSAFNLFALDHTDRMVFGWEMPAGWLQNIKSVFHRRSGTGVWDAVDPAWLQEPVDSSEVRLRIGAAGRRLLRSGMGIDVHRRGYRKSYVAGRHLLLSHGRGALSQPDRLEQRHQTLASRVCQPDDGDLVHGCGPRQSHCGARCRPD